ncbi:hypothetical protein niasHT_039700 [Heterodera trifolii]|uniref:Uncharacterized protein n=1 Tax=Heterodera trifolii TaxID=157864 RepID=A0ABD2IKR2_9BILA
MAAIGDEKERANFERLILNNGEFRGEMEEKEKAISNGQRKMEPNEIAELVEKHFKVMGEHKMEGEEEEKAETKVRLLLLMLFGIMPNNKHMEGKKIWKEKIWEEKWQKHLKDLIKKRQDKASNTKKLGTDNLEKTKKTLNEFGNKVISAEWKKLGKMRKLYYGIGNFKTDQQRFYALLTECISLLTGNYF